MSDAHAENDGIPFVDPHELVADGNEIMARMRKVTPVIRTAERRLSVLRAEDVQKLAADPRVVQVPGDKFSDAMLIPQGRSRAFVESFMLMANGEDHKRRRGAFAKTFAHPLIRGKRADVRAVADAIVADLPRDEPFDLLALWASRLPAEVIAKTLGLPTDQSAWFAGHVYMLSRILAPPYDLEMHDQVEASGEALYGFVSDALEARRADPRDDLLSMLATDESARALAPEELVYQVMGVILGGSDTTRSALNTIVGLLLEDRSRWDEVDANRDLIPAAIDEALRIDPPIGSMPRFAPVPFELDGVTVAAGELVALSTLSALRDGASFADPGSFDLHRSDHVRPHLVFGGGAHRCLGEMLARIELEEGIASLMDAAPDIEMLEAPHMVGYGGIRQSTPLIARIPSGS